LLTSVRTASGHNPETVRFFVRLSQLECGVNLSLAKTIAY
jgi:hypothetical protein